MPALQVHAMKAKQPAVEAVRLLGKWQRVSAGHVVFGAGCACGAGPTSVRVQDMEQDILAYLEGRHGRGAASLADLLSAMARERGSEGLALLADLERSLDSFEEMHRVRTS
jgi:hypothetical protein